MRIKSRTTARGRGPRLLAALALAAAGLAAALAPVLAGSGSRADEVTASVNNLRDGWDPAETTGALTPSALGKGLGELFAAQVDGQVYAQPVVAGRTVIVATENDWVYGLDAATGDVAWSSFLPALVNPSAPGTAWPASAENCTDLAPNVGVTGTPVYDAAAGVVYLVSEEVPAGHTVLSPAFYLHALNAQTGAERPGWPVLIHGAPVNDPTVPFDPFTQLQRPGLLLLGGSVYAAFGSHCDFMPYDGYVVGVNVAKRTQTMWTDEAGIASTQAGIWQSGSGLMSDGAGRIFFASGNGISPPPGPGPAPPPELAESVVRLAVQADGTLVAKDFFSPANAPFLDAHDRDLGAGGPVGLPFGVAAYPHLLVEGGKPNFLFVLSRDSLGGRERGPHGTDAVVSEVRSVPGQWGHPAVFADTPMLTAANTGVSNDYVYYVGYKDVLKYFKAVLRGGRTPILTDVANSSDTFGYTSGSPVVTSNGANPASAVVWVAKSSDVTGASGNLEAFPAVPTSSHGSCSGATPCTVSPIWTSAPFQGAGKFTIPATDNGRVYVATRGVPSNGTNCPAVPSGDYCGQVLGFGAAPLGAAAPPPFGYVGVGTQSAPAQVTVTNNLSAGDVRVSSAPTASGPFAVAGPYEYTPKGGSPGPAGAFPVTLHPGDSLTAQGITFDPAAAGGASGALTFATNSPGFPVFSLGLSGFGERLGFAASVATATFSNVPTGTTAQQQVTVVNTESVPQALSAGAPGAPFAVSGLPSTQVQPGQSVPLTITYSPSSAGSDGPAKLALTGNDGTNSTETDITLNGTAVADQSALTATPAVVKFGQVPLGQQVTATIDVANTGNLPAVVTATAAPPIPFGVPDQVTSGLPVNPGYVVQIPVTFTPAGIGSVSGQYQLTWTDVTGQHPLSVQLSGRGARPAAGIAVPPPGGGWTFNGGAAMAGAGLSLTPLAANQAGSAVYSVPVPSDGLTATFTAKIGGGSGADGLTFALLDPAAAQTALGGTGGQLGFGGLHGVAVTLDTSKDGLGYPSANFVGVATSAGGASLSFVTTSTKVPALRAGTHVIGVGVSGGQLAVTVDGVKCLSVAVALPPTVRLAFTGATGAQTDSHVVSGVAITAGGHQVPAPGGGWSFNGAAVAAGSDAALTPGLAASEAGSVVYTVPVRAVGLKVTFTARLAASGGDGMTLALLNPAAAGPGTVGSPGVYLGLGTSHGLPGVGVVLGTDGLQSPAGPPPDYVATTAKVGGGGLVFQQVAKGIGPLTAGTQKVTVTVTSGGSLGPVLTVWLNGVRVLQRAEPGLTSTVRLAFTGGTGATPELQLVTSVAAAAAG